MDNQALIIIAGIFALVAVAVIIRYRKRGEAEISIKDYFKFRFRGSNQPEDQITIKSKGSHFGNIAEIHANKVIGGDNINIYNQESTNNIQNIILEQEQKDLLVELVEIVRGLPRNQRKKFILVQDRDGTTLICPGHPNNNIDVLVGDLETLAREGLLAQTYSSNGSSNFDITPLGFRFCDHVLPLENTKNFKG